MIDEDPMIPRPTISLNDTAFNTVQVLPSEHYSRSQPLLIDAPEEIRQSVQRNVEVNPVIPPDARVGRLRNAIVIKRGILITGGRRIISESLINMDNRARFESEIGPAYDDVVNGHIAIPIVPHSNMPHVMLKQTWDENYGHWLIESLPRVDMVRRLYGLDGFRFIVSENASPAMRKIYIDTLAGMGVCKENIAVIPDDTWFIPDVIYPSPITVQPWVKSPVVIRTLEELAGRLADSNVQSCERLFVSRNNWNNRKLINEVEIIAFIEKRGYRLIHPELYSFSEQISLFSKARFVVGTLGAALTNIVFARSGVNLLALATEHMGDDFFWDLVSLKGGHYTSLHGKATNPERGMYSNFSIDLSKFESVLASFEA